MHTPPRERGSPAGRPGTPLSCPRRTGPVSPAPVPSSPSPDPTAEGPDAPAASWWKRLGVAGFMFFLIKGLLWLAIPAVAVLFGAEC